MPSKRLFRVKPTAQERTQMEWTQLLDPRRLCRPDYADKPNRPAYLQDYDRILVF